jgi:hypothetical protein
MIRNQIKTTNKCLPFSFGKIYGKTPQNIMIYVVQIFFRRSLFYVQYFYGCLTYYQNKNIFEKLGHGAIQKIFAQFSINTFRQFKTAVNKSNFFPLQALI